MEIAPRISVDAEVCHGAAVITGTRVMVWVILEALVGGLNKEEVAREYGLATEDIDAALAFAAHLVMQTDVVPLPGA